MRNERWLSSISIMPMVSFTIDSNPCEPFVSEFELIIRGRNDDLCKKAEIFYQRISSITAKTELKIAFTRVSKNKVIITFTCHENNVISVFLHYFVVMRVQFELFFSNASELILDQLKLLMKYLESEKMVALLNQYQNLEEKNRNYLAAIKTNYYQAIVSIIGDLTMSKFISGSIGIKRHLEEMTLFLNHLSTTAKNYQIPKRNSLAIVYKGLYQLLTQLARQFGDSHQRLVEIAQSEQYSVNYLISQIQLLTPLINVDLFERPFSQYINKPILSVCNWLLYQLVKLIQQNKVFNQQTIDFILARMNNQYYDEKAWIHWLEMLTRADQLKMMTESIVEKIIMDQIIDRSCQSRLKGSGLEAVANRKEQQYWSMCSEYAVEWVQQQTNLSIGLFAMMSYLAKFRNKIACVSNSLDAQSFGVWRTKRNGDWFDRSENSATSSDIYFDLLKVTKMTVNLTTDHPSDDPFHQFCMKEKVIECELENVLFPLRRIRVRIDRSNQDSWISTHFSLASQEQIIACINVIDHHYFKSLRQSKTIDNPYLEKMGECIYYLCVLYPYDRGSAAIIQWLICGQLEARCGGKFSQILMGDNDQIPFDVYAHLVADPREYGVEFRKTITKMIELGQSLQINKRVY